MKGAIFGACASPLAVDVRVSHSTHNSVSASAELRERVHLQRIHRVSHDSCADENLATKRFAGFSHSFTALTHS